MDMWPGPPRDEDNGGCWEPEGFQEADEDEPGDWLPGADYEPSERFPGEWVMGPLYWMLRNDADEEDD